MPSVAETSVESDDLAQREFCDVVGTITQSLSSVREVVKSLRDKQRNSTDLDTKEGISLLSLKHHLMLSYLQSLTLLSSHRALGHAVDDRSPPTQSFSSADREARGSGAGDLIDYMVEGRVVLEKIKVLEGRMRYQIEKLVRVAEGSSSQNIIDDPLAFRPNPQNLVSNAADESGEDEDDSHPRDRDDIYHPPRLAAMPYTEPKRDKKARRAPVPSALASLAHQDPSRPHIESTSGLGAMPSLSSNRAREIHRMAEFEEENFTRLVMKKKDMKRRKKDEEDIALGGSGGISGRRRGGGFEDEFGDVLRSVGRQKAGAVGDGYEELRMKGKKRAVLDRSRTRGPDLAEEVSDDGPRQRKRSRFEKEAKAARSRVSQKSRK
ncbi:hypothetical protein HWV62_10022 [Athelia sp. TMB]|nr:hypothetical protein HWV62_10022 [Athelia sp. TMB]